MTASTASRAIQVEVRVNVLAKLELFFHSSGRMRRLPACIAQPLLTAGSVIPRHSRRPRLSHFWLGAVLFEQESQFFKGLILDLPHAFSRPSDRLAHFFKGSRSFAAQAKA